MAKETFSDVVKEEIIYELMYVHQYSKSGAEKFAEKYSSRIEWDMWHAFKISISEIVDNIKDKRC